MKSRTIFSLLAALMFVCVPAHAIPYHFEVTGVIDTEVSDPSLFGIGQGTTFTGWLTFDPETLVHEVRDTYSGGWLYEIEIAGYTITNGCPCAMSGGFSSTGVGVFDEMPITVGPDPRDMADLVALGLSGPFGPELDVSRATGGAFSLLLVRFLGQEFGGRQSIDVVGHFTDIRVVPEPATLGLFGLGLLGAAAFRRRRQ